MRTKFNQAVKAIDQLHKLADSTKFDIDVSHAGKALRIKDGCTRLSSNCVIVDSK